MKSLCSNWEFVDSWTQEFLEGKTKGQQIRIPHTCKELPLHYIDTQDYEMVCGYRRELEIPADCKDKRLFLQFDGAAHIATVYINGVEAAEHRCGYTAFRVEITDLVKPGEKNTVAVKLDTRESSNVPPFGFVIDYLTYGGIYREVWLDIRPQTFVEDIFAYTPTLDTAKIQITLNGSDVPEGSTLMAYIADMDGNIVWTHEASAVSGSFEATVPEAKPWKQEDPVLYKCGAIIADAEGHPLDSLEQTFGFRTAEFQKDGFYLNGKKTFMRGLNRHQCFPYVGDAVPERLQRYDAHILRDELGCNAMRTSHYPQSQHFMDECDKLGMLVFTELPGWQHIGDAEWQDQAVENVREMVMQYRNHPSIVVWGVRINESQDDDAFYTRTNALAHELDPSRSTTGVRYFEKSSLLEDVYSYNDFSHNGKTPGVMPKSKVTPDMGKALIISEHNGHMYPTKSFDDSLHRQQQALRHSRVLNDAMADGEHAGCFGWCMFDYPTHKDFGSGDRICYHGVLDAWRNPKLAASLYASQADIPEADGKEDERDISTAGAVLEISSTMDIGDYPAGQIGPVYAFTNAEEVELYKNGEYVGKLDASEFSALDHPPFVAEDTIGNLLESQEGFEPAKAADIRSCLLAAKKYGLAGLPVKYKLKFQYCMTKYGLTYADAADLYGKYVANWGGEATSWRFDAKHNGEIVKSVTCCPSAKLHLDVVVSHTDLVEADTYDMASIRIRIIDENGTVAHYLQAPISIEAEGEIELVGPSLVTAEGGMCGTFVKTTGRAGTGKVTISTAQADAVSVGFEIETN